VEAAVELDGSLYKKQGTRVNVRVLVIGDLLENNRTYEVPHELPIINNVQDLWRWSENVLQKRLQPELSYDEPSPSINQSES
ncbi:hypothetical protein, partial [Citrobacter freundii]